MWEYLREYWMLLTLPIGIAASMVFSIRMIRLVVKFINDWFDKIEKRY